MITVILVVLIILVPISAFSYIRYGPARLESISLDFVSSDLEKRDGLRVLATTTGSGVEYEGRMNLQVRFDNELIHTEKIDFIDGLANHKMYFEDFCVGNGKYDFRLIHEDLRDELTYEVDIIAEELGVVSTATYNLQGSGYQPWEALYSYHVVFKTGWNFFTHTIKRDDFRSYQLGTQFAGTSAPLKVRTGPDDGCRVEVWFTNQGGAQKMKHQFNVPANDLFETTVEFTQNGSYLYKYINEKIVDIQIEAYENRPVDKIPDGGQLIVTQELGPSETLEDPWPITMIDQVAGWSRPDFGPGNYTMTIDYANPQMRAGHQLSTLSFSEVIELNDKPRAIGKVNPSQISTLQRTVTFSAVDSFDDGPKADLIVFWSFGKTSAGEEIHAEEGPWEDYKEITYTYAFGEDPDVTTGKPSLILKDRYGAVSAKVEINLSVA
jgi:hypothetical protein